MRPLAAPRRQWPRAEPEQDTRQPRSSTISEGSAGSCSPRDLPRSATALKMLVGTGGSCPAGPTLAAPREVEPPGQATVPLLCRPNHAASPSLPAQQQKESGGGKSEGIFWKSFHSTFRRTNPWHPHLSYASVLSGALLFWKEERRGTILQYFWGAEVTRGSTYSFCCVQASGEKAFPPNRVPVLLLLLWGGNWWRKQNCIPAPAVKRRRTDLLPTRGPHLQALYNADSGM